MHGLCAYLEFEWPVSWSDNDGVQGLIPILFWGGDVVFEGVWEWPPKGVDDAKNSVAVSGCCRDNAECREVFDVFKFVGSIDDFFVDAVDMFDSSCDFRVDALPFEFLLEGVVCFVQPIGAFFFAFVDFF